MQNIWIHVYQKVLSTLYWRHLTFQFPRCTEDQAISVACLDLHYYVSVSSHVKETDENYDHSPITLNDLRPEDELTLTQSRSMDFEGKCQFSFTYIFKLEVLVIPLSASMQYEHKKSSKLVRSV